MITIQKSAFIFSVHNYRGSLQFLRLFLKHLKVFGEIISRVFSISLTDSFKKLWKTNTQEKMKIC